jgi:hypothetical protein
LQDAIGFYQSIAPDKVQLLIAVDSENKTIGRALLWYDVECDGNKINYLDRVYSANDNITQLFIDYAEAHNLKTYKTNNMRLNIEINIDEDSPMPYFDTFSYYNFNDGLNSSGGDVNFDSVDGLSINDIHSPLRCHECNCRLDRDEAIYSESIDDNLCQHCAVYDDECDIYIPLSDAVIIDGVGYSRDSDSIVHSNYEDEYILRDDAVYSEQEEDYFSSGNDDIVYSEYMEDYILHDDAVYSEQEEDYFIKESVNYCSITKDYYTIETSVFSKFHNTFILLDESVYVEHLDDRFLHDAECIYYDSDSDIYKHKQYSFALMVV